ELEIPERLFGHTSESLRNDIAPVIRRHDDRYFQHHTRSTNDSISISILVSIVRGVPRNCGVATQRRPSARPARIARSGASDWREAQPSSAATSHPRLSHAYANLYFRQLCRYKYV